MNMAERSCRVMSDSANDRGEDTIFQPKFNQTRNMRLLFFGLISKGAPLGPATMYRVLQGVAAWP